MNKNEVARKLTKVNQIMEEVIYGLTQTGMTYRQAEEEVFTMLNRMRVSKEAKAELGGLTHSYPFLPKLFSQYEVRTSWA